MFLIFSPFLHWNYPSTYLNILPPIEFVLTSLIVHLLLGIRAVTKLACVWIQNFVMKIMWICNSRTKNTCFDIFETFRFSNDQLLFVHSCLSNFSHTWAECMPCMYTHGSLHGTHHVHSFFTEKRLQLLFFVEFGVQFSFAQTKTPLLDRKRTQCRQLRENETIFTSSCYIVVSIFWFFFYFSYFGFAFPDLPFLLIDDTKNSIQQFESFNRFNLTYLLFNSCRPAFV